MQSKATEDEFHSTLYKMYVQLNLKFRQLLNKLKETIPGRDAIFELLLQFPAGVPRITISVA